MRKLTTLRDKSADTNIFSTHIGTDQMSKMEEVKSPIRKRRTCKVECDKCGMSFSSKRELNKHAASHCNDPIHPNTLLKCGHCDEILTTESFQDRHFHSVHSDLEPHTEPCAQSFKCDICCREFGTLKAWLSHVQNHNIDEMYTCLYCSKRFKQPLDLIQHTLVHSGRVDNLPGLTNNDNLGVKPGKSRERHLCPHCTSSYVHKKMLLSHIKKVHDTDNNTAVEQLHTPRKTRSKAQVDNGSNVDDSTEAGNLEDLDDEDRDMDWDPPTESSSPKRRGKLNRTITKVEELPAEVVATDYPCDICDTVFYSHGDLRQHFVKDHSGKVECVPCGLMFNHRRGLRRHRVRCHGPKSKDWVCEVCGKAFDCSYALSTHRRVHFAPKKHACDICGMKFQRPENMRRHKSRHSGIKAFMCDVCGNRYSTKFILQKHYEIHVDVNDKTFSCDTCGDRFAKENVLRRHKQSDCGRVSRSGRGRQPGQKNQSSRQQLPFPCNMCKKGFKEKEVLDRHIKGFHTNDESLICLVCGIRFRTLATLETHNLGHSSESRHKCRFCDKEFVRETLKDIHERERHTGETPYQCQVCDEAFSRKGKLAAHRRVHLGKQISCEICNMIFSKTDTKIKHMKSHTNERPFACNVCHRTFKEKYNLETHTRTHSNQKFSCRTCDECFTDANEWKNHMRSHELNGTEKRGPNFACDICGFLFSTSVELVEHTKSHTTESVQRNPPAQAPATKSSKRSQSVKIVQKPPQVEEHQNPILVPIADIEFLNNDESVTDHHKPDSRTHDQRMITPDHVNQNAIPIQQTAQIQNEDLHHNLVQLRPVSQQQVENLAQTGQTVSLVGHSQQQDILATAIAAVTQQQQNIISHQAVSTGGENLDVQSGGVLNQFGRQQTFSIESIPRPVFATSQQPVSLEALQRMSAPNFTLDQIQRPQLQVLETVQTRANQPILNMNLNVGQNQNENQLFFLYPN